MLLQFWKNEMIHWSKSSVDTVRKFGLIKLHLECLIVERCAVTIICISTRDLIHAIVIIVYVCVCSACKKNNLKGVQSDCRLNGTALFQDFVQEMLVGDRDIICYEHSTHGVLLSSNFCEEYWIVSSFYLTEAQTKL